MTSKCSVLGVEPVHLSVHPSLPTIACNVLESTPANSTMASLIDLLNMMYAAIQTNILRYLNVVDVICLSKTSRRLNLWHIEQATTYNIDYHLRGYFSKPCTFRRLQRDIGILVAGNFAQKFLAGKLKGQDRFRVFVRHQEYARLESFLKQEGYTRESSATEDPMFIKEDSAKRLKIKGYPTRRTEGQEVLETTSTTACFTFLSWNKLYCLFPRTTLLHRQIHAVREPSENLNGVLRLHRRAGLSIMGVHLPGTCSQDVTRPRSIGDKHTLIINLDTTNIATTPSSESFSAAEPDFVLESTTFQVAVTRPTSEGLQHYELQPLQIPRHPVLRYEYTLIGGKEIWAYKTKKYREKLEMMVKWLDEMTVMELGQIQEDERPDFYDRIISGDIKAASTRGLFTLPEGWTYYDKEVLQSLDNAWTQVLEYQERFENSKVGAPRVF
jgi:hypothetical protein